MAANGCDPQPALGSGEVAGRYEPSKDCIENCGTVDWKNGVCGSQGGLVNLGLWHKGAKTLPIWRYSGDDKWYHTDADSKPNVVLTED